MRLSATGIAFLPAMTMPTVPTADDPELEEPSQTTMDHLERLKIQVEELLQDVRAEQDSRAKVEEINKGISQEQLANIVRLAAGRDVRDGPLSRDAIQPVQDSLKGAWWPLEWIPLQSRDYTHPGAEADSVWK